MKVHGLITNNYVGSCQGFTVAITKVAAWSIQSPTSKVINLIEAFLFASLSYFKIKMNKLCPFFIAICWVWNVAKNESFPYFDNTSITSSSRIKLISTCIVNDTSSNNTLRLISILMYPLNFFILLCREGSTYTPWIL